MPLVQQRRGTAAQLAAINETPLEGQIYFETDTNKVKVGDGVRAYNSLPYLSESTSIADLDGLQAALDANAAAAAAAANAASSAQATADGALQVGLSLPITDNSVVRYDSGIGTWVNSNTGSTLLGATPAGGWPAGTTGAAVVAAQSTADGAVADAAAAQSTADDALPLSGGSVTGTVTFPAQTIVAAGVYINQFGVGIGGSPSAGGPLTVRGDIDNYDPNAPGHRITTTQVRITGADRSISASAQGLRFAAADFYFVDYATQQTVASLDASGLDVTDSVFCDTLQADYINTRNPVGAAAVSVGALKTVAGEFPQHKSRHATNGTDPLSPSDIGAATAADLSSAQSDISTLQSDVALAQADITFISGNYAQLQNGLVPAANLPSYVDDVIEGAGTGSFPATGEPGKIYVDTTTNKTYRWSGSVYVEITASPGSTDAVPEGSVNLYYTDARVTNVIGTSSISSLSDVGAGVAGQPTPNTVLAFSASTGAWESYSVGATRFGSPPLGGWGAGTVGEALAAKADTAGDTFTGDVNIGDGNTQSSLRFATNQNQFDANATDLDYITLYRSGTNVAGMGVTTSNFNIGTSGAINYSLYAHGTLVQRSNSTISRYYVDQSMDSGRILLDSSLTTSPALAFRNDVNTGIKRAANGNFDIQTAGVNRFSITQSGDIYFGTAGTTFVNNTLSIANGLALTELQSGGASTNDVLTWSGTAWVPTAGGGGSTTLAVLTDTNIASPASSQFLIYNGTAWQNYSPATAAAFLPISSLSGQAISAPATGEMLRYDGTNWVNAAASITDVTNLQSTLNSKVDTTDARLSDARTPTAHTHPQTDITNLVSDLAAKVDTTDSRLSDARTPLAHTHAQSDITNLVSDLAGKASANHSHDLDTLSDYTLASNAGEGPVIRKGGGNGFFYTNVGYGTFAGNINIQDLNNVSVSSAATGDVLAFNGTGWANASPGVASDTTQAGGGTAVNNIVVISQAAYTALGTKDPNTIYFIT